MKNSDKIGVFFVKLILLDIIFPLNFISSMIFRTRAFTLVELMIVIMILGILFVGLYMGVQPYMMRARDTKRVTAIQNYLNNIISTYERNQDTFPANTGSGNNTLGPDGYCLTELGTRTFDDTNRKDMKFSVLNNGTSSPPSDPSNQTTYAPLCSMSGSYIYSRMKYGSDSEIALIAAKLELKTSANYGTGADLTDVAKVQDLIMAKKSTVPDAATEQLYIVTALH